MRGVATRDFAIRMPSPDPVPYISIVVAAPAGLPPEQLEALIDRWNRRSAAFGLSSELIVVPCGQSDSAARNAGIRKARGEFVLNTAIDLEFSDELMQFLAARRLQEGRLYRIDLHEGNRLHAREGSFRLTAEGFRENFEHDIVSQPGINLGEGWFPPERDRETGEIFRWIDDHAEVTLQAPAAGGAIALEVEPGPGVGPLPQVLRVFDTAGNQVASWTISGRATLQLWAPPAAAGGPQTFRLSPADGGRPLLDDLRILNFRFFRCDWVRFAFPAASPKSLLQLRPTLTRLATSGGFWSLAPAITLLRSTGGDVFGPGIEYWGQGWHRLEESGAEKFRWVSKGAEIVVPASGQAQDLFLLAEPGPSLNRRPFDLHVHGESGRRIGKSRVSGLTLLRISLPPASTPALLFLSPDQQGEALPGDSRVLNFRVFACACLPSERPLPARDSSLPAGWTAVTVGQIPAGVDWTARNKRHGSELAEIGKPVFLHVNACEFILMDREQWFDLRGLPEADDPPEYLNALFCYTAHFAGALEEVLREPLNIRRTHPSERAPAALDKDLIWLITQMRRWRAPAILNAPAAAAGWE
uniref:Uncharacterized protein n=1 Tax=Solibacter usitatus (strain Ellin6076) TaxID=234267 RepID=Q02BJ6_SOLUE